MELVVLAAGRGTRLRPHTEETPKPLLSIKNGNSFLDYHIRNAEKIDCVDKVSIVTGYESEKIKSYIEDIESDIECQALFNPFFQHGPITSIWRGLVCTKGEEVVLVNGDTYFSRSVIEAIINSEASIAVSQSEPYSEDAMKVKMNSKNILKSTGKDFHSEYLSSGAIYLPTTAIEEVSYIIESIMRDENISDYYWHDVVAKLSSVRKVQCVTVPISDWFEVDSPGELKKLRDKL